MYDLIYYQAKSHEKLGNGDVAQEMFKNLINRGQEQMDRGSQSSLVAVEEASYTNHKTVSNSYYLQALGNKGLGNKEEAQRLFESALKAYNHNLWAKIMMNN